MSVADSSVVKGTVMSTGLAFLSVGANMIVLDSKNPGGYVLTLVGFLLVVLKYFIFKPKEGK